MKKILFIVPPNLTFDSFVNPAFNERTVAKKNGVFGSVVNEMPLGLLSISSYLKKYVSAEIKLLDFNIVLNKMDSFEYNSFSDMFNEVLSTEEWINFAPEIIGVSTLFTPSYYSMLQIADSCRKLFPNAFITAGGGVPTNLYKKIFEENESFDALCYGEGEKPFLSLIKAGDRKKFLSSHHSWITRDKAAGVIPFQHDFIDDLDEIPFLEFDMLNAADYRINPLQSLFPLAQEEKIGMPAMTSRGCTHHCCFCSSHTVHGRKMRYQSIERVRVDFTRLKEQYNVGTIIFFDDHLMSDKKRALAIIGIMKELDLTAFFPSSLALYALDRKILEALKSIGVNQLVLSVESGSSRVLKEIMHKPLNLSIVQRVIDDCRDLGIASDVSILIGLPGETKNDIEDARAFLKTLKPTWTRISMATPLAGSEMLEICQKKGYLKGDYISCDFKKAIVETSDFSAEYIQEKAYSLNLELNFIDNSDFKLGNYETALKEFENTIKIKSDHAFAFYFAAKCCEMLNLDEKYREYKVRHQEILEQSEFWNSYERQFGLPPLN